MRTILTVKDIAERYKCSLQCARNYIRKMPHMESPLTVYESDLQAWEESRMVYPGVYLKAPKIGKMIVPRTREGKSSEQIRRTSKVG